MIFYDPADKRLGGYLIDAGLLTPAQVDVALTDQIATGMRFGDIIIERGWVKQQTIEYLYRKIIALEREIGQPLDKGVVQTSYSLRKHRYAESEQIS
jgi:deoxyribose-phosphate aldolase